MVVAGLGKQADFTSTGPRPLAPTLARFLRGKRIAEAATIAHGAGIGRPRRRSAAAQAIAEGTLLGLYRFTAQEAG